MVAIRPLADNARAVRAAVSLILSGRLCACGTPDWHVANVHGGLRYLKCRCGRTAKLGPGQVAAIVKRAAETT